MRARRKSAFGLTAREKPGPFAFRQPSRNRVAAKPKPHVILLTRRTARAPLTAKDKDGPDRQSAAYAGPAARAVGGGRGSDRTGGGRAGQEGEAGPDAAMT